MPQKLGQGLVDAVVDTYQTYTPQPIQDYVTAVGEATAQQEQELQELLPEPVARLSGIDATQMTLAGISDFTNVAQPLIQAAFFGAEALVGKRVERLTQPMQAVSRMQTQLDKSMQLNQKLNRKRGIENPAGELKLGKPTPAKATTSTPVQQADTSVPGLNTDYPASKPFWENRAYEDGALSIDGERFKKVGVLGNIVLDDVSMLPKEFLASKGITSRKALTQRQQFRLLQEFAMKRIRQLPPGNYFFGGATDAHEKLYARLFSKTQGFEYKGKNAFYYSPQNDPLSLYSRRQRHRQQ